MNRQAATITSTYRIRVAGHLDQHWSAWLDGFALTHGDDGSTVITGPVADQAQLHGMLARLRDLGVPLLSLTSDGSGLRAETAADYVDCVNSRQLPPVAAVISFIDCANRGDIDGLGELMAEDHELIVFSEEALRGRAANIQAWAGYAAAYPDYVIYPRAVAEPRDGCVAVLGHTTGSHLGLADHQERALSVIWLAEVQDGRLRCWRLLEDTPSRRTELGLTPPA